MNNNMKEQYCLAKELLSKSKRNKKKAIKILKTLKNYAPAQFLLASLIKGNSKRNSKKVMGLFLSALPYYQNTTEADDAER